MHRAEISELLEHEITVQRNQIKALEDEARRLRYDIRLLVDSLQSLSGPFECCAIAYKSAESSTAN